MLPVLISIGPVKIYSFSLVLLTALLLSSFVFWKRAREEYYDDRDLLDGLLVCLIWAAIGGRLGYILLNFDQFGLNLIYWLSISSKPGFWWLGMMAGGWLGFSKFCRDHKWKVMKSLDLLVMGVSLAHAVINLGLFLNGSGIGRVTGLPVGVLLGGGFERRHPIGLYGAILWLIVFGYLWWVEGRYRRFVWYQRSKGDAQPGFLLFSYLTALGGIGLILELMSESELVISGVNVEMGLRVGVLVVGLMGIYVRSGLKGALNGEQWLSGLTKVWKRQDSGKRRQGWVKR